MISRVGEWYRIVNVQPASETIDKRTASVRALVEQLTGGDHWDIVLGLTAGVVAGFETASPDAAHVTELTGALKAHDSAFVQDLSENALELRAVAAIVFGELLTRSGEKPADSKAVMIALAIESGTGLRRRPVGKHLNAVLAELAGIARRVLWASQQHRRKRASSASKKVLNFDENVSDPLPAFKSLTVAVKAALRELAQQAAVDREELDILWWLYAGTSETAGLPLAELAAGKAAIAVGVEVADLCLLPPLSNADAFVRKAMREVKRADSKRGLDKIVAETDPVVWTRFLLEGVGAEDGNPQLFPLAWLCGRLSASGGAAGWSAEFKAKTGIPADLSVSPVELAVQTFRERVGLRHYASAD